MAWHGDAPGRANCTAAACELARDDTKRARILLPRWLTEPVTRVAPPATTCCPLPTAHCPPPRAYRHMRPAPFPITMCVRRVALPAVGGCARRDSTRELLTISRYTAILTPTRTRTRTYLLPCGSATMAGWQASDAATLPAAQAGSTNQGGRGGLMGGSVGGSRSKQDRHSGGAGRADSAAGSECVVRHEADHGGGSP